MFVKNRIDYLKIDDVWKYFFRLFFIACGLVLLILGCTMMFCGDANEEVEEKPREQQESPDDLDQSFLRLVSQYRKYIL